MLHPGGSGRLTAADQNYLACPLEVFFFFLTRNKSLVPTPPVKSLLFYLIIIVNEPLLRLLGELLQLVNEQLSPSSPGPRVYSSLLFGPRRSFVSPFQFPLNASDRFILPNGRRRRRKRGGKTPTIKLVVCASPPLSGFCTLEIDGAFMAPLRSGPAASSRSPRVPVLGLME